MQIPNHKFYNCIVTTSDGNSYNVEANWLHNTNNTQWNGWSCNAGLDRICIAPDGKVYGSECMNDCLGDITSGWQLLAKPTVCHQAGCTGCTDDLIVAKEK